MRIKSAKLNKTNLFLIFLISIGACDEPPLDPCEGVDCSGHGTCYVIGQSTPECECYAGYYRYGFQCLPDTSDADADFDIDDTGDTDIFFDSDIDSDPDINLDSDLDTDLDQDSQELEECGDGSCDITETATNCPTDCPPICGDDECTHEENICSCEDCDECGDGNCTFREAQSSSCSLDCSSSSWVLICPGTFTMGSPTEQLGRADDEALHEVTLTNKFFIHRTEITNEYFYTILDRTPSPTITCPDCPVSSASWHEAALFCNTLSIEQGFTPCYNCIGTGPDITCNIRDIYSSPYECLGYRLPTEAEWEYSARAGTTEATYAGELDDVLCASSVIDTIGWYCGNSGDATHPVGSLAANVWGLYDMLGNAWEWCHDWYSVYGEGPQIDPWGPASGTVRVLRGGSKTNEARHTRSASRFNNVPTNRYHGFRVVRTTP